MSLDYLHHRAYRMGLTTAPAPNVMGSIHPDKYKFVWLLSFFLPFASLVRCFQYPFARFAFRIYLSFRGRDG